MSRVSLRQVIFHGALAWSGIFEEQSSATIWVNRDAFFNLHLITHYADIIGTQSEAYERISHFQTK